MIYLTRMLGPVILDKEEENQIDHTKDKTKLISNIRKHPMRPNQTRMYDASFSLFKEEEITFQHKWAFISDKISFNIKIPIFRLTKITNIYTLLFHQIEP